MHCGGALPEIFKSIHSLQFLSEGAETEQDDTKHQSAHSLWVRFSDFFGGRCWGAFFEIFKSIYSLQYSSDWAETSYQNARHQSAQSLRAGSFRCKERGSKFQNFLRTTIVHVSSSRRRRNLYLVNLRDDRSVHSALFYYVISPNWPYKIVENSVRPSVTSSACQHYFSMSSHIIGTNILKVYWMLLDMGPHNHSVPDFAISGHMTQKMRLKWPTAFLSPPSLLDRPFRNFMLIQDIGKHIHSASDISISGHVT